MNTTLPSSSSPAMRTAIEAMAPLDTPAKMPSSSSSRRVHTIASWLVTKILRSSTERSMIGGMNPSSRERSPWTGSPRLGSPAPPLPPLRGPHLPRVAELLLEAPSDPHQRAPGAQPGHERRDLVELLEDLRRRAVVVRERVGLVAVLVGHVVRRVALRHVQRHLDGAVGALGPLAVDDLRAVHLQQLRA